MESLLNNTITACYIARSCDGEALGRSLASIDGFVDEVIVCVTDDEAPMCVALPGDMPTIKSFKWIDDFAAARNASIKDVTTDWILYIDCDEVLYGGEWLRRLAKTEDVDAIGLNVRCPNVDGSFVMNMQLRLFRRGLRFRQRIHEQLYDPTEPGRTLNAASQGRALIMHHGYVADEETRAARLERNLRLLDLAMNDDPDSCGLHLQRARQDGIEGKEALASAIRALELWDGVNPRLGALIWATVAIRHYTLQDWNTIIETYEKCPPNLCSSELLLVAGQAMMQLNMYDEAVEVLRHAMDGNVLHEIGGDPAAWTWKPLATLGELYTGLARQHFRSTELV